MLGSDLLCAWEQRLALALTANMLAAYLGAGLLRRGWATQLQLDLVCVTV